MERGNNIAEVNVSPFATQETVVAEAKIFLRMITQQFFSSFASRGNISGNRVSATMFPRLRAPLRMDTITSD